MINSRRKRVWVIVGCCFWCIAALRAPTAWARELFPVQQPTVKFASGPILAAGDGQTLWVARPLSGENIPTCQLYVHPANKREGDKPLWLLVQANGAAVHPWMPQTMALMGAAGKPGERALAVIVESGAVRRIDMGESRFLTRLTGQRTVAALGLKNDLFMLSVGPADLNTPPAAPAATQPATVPAASAPATTRAAASAPAPASQFWNLLTLGDGRWEQRAGLGPVSDTQRTPGPGAAALGVYEGKILATWVGEDHRLVVRMFDPARPAAGWAEPVRSEITVAAAKVWPVTIGPRTFVFWARQGAHDAHGELCGGPLESDGRLAHPLPNMDLGAALAGLADQSVAVAPTGNSIMAVFTDDKDTLQSTLFSAEGVRIEGPATVELRRFGTSDTSVLPGLTMLVLMGLLALSLWQWRQKQPVPPTKNPTRVARVSVRLAAAIIDLALPLIVVAGVYQVLDIPGERVAGLVAAWSEGSAPHWSVLLTSAELLWIAALYLVHVTAGELYWGRSLGKALCHLRVIALNGGKPTALAVLVRNFVRVFEIIGCPLLIYMLMNPNRQRLGDLLARTLVISEAPVAEKKPSRRNNED